VESARDFVLNGWRLKKSFFEYQINTYNSNFGLGTEFHKTGIPELYFTIQLERTFIDAFITNLVPQLVALLMLLAMMVTISGLPEKREQFGSNRFAIIGACSALFFVVLVAHIQLRQQLALGEIFYLEYFFFLMYIAILWVSLSAFLIITDKPFSFIGYKDGLVLKILFLPLVLFSLFIITFIVFFT